jgi:CRP-like cAMP-binding protein
LIAHAPALAGAVMRDMAADFGALVQQVLDLKLRSTPQRLGCYLLEQVENPESARADFRLPFDKGLLAARLGCRQENLSRAFATLRDVGVETHGARVVLHDVAALRGYALPDAPVGDGPTVV